MKVKGIAVVQASETMPHDAGDGKVGIAFDDATLAALGWPDSDDAIMVLTTRNPAFHEVVCLSGIPPECRDLAHLVAHHEEEIEVAIRLFKLRRPKH